MPRAAATTRRAKKRASTPRNDSPTSGVSTAHSISPGKPAARGRKPGKRAAAKPKRSLSRSRKATTARSTTPSRRRSNSRSRSRSRSRSVSAPKKAPARRGRGAKKTRTSARSLSAHTPPVQASCPKSPCSASCRHEEGPGGQVALALNAPLLLALVSFVPRRQEDCGEARPPRQEVLIEPTAQPETNQQKSQHED
ncbi:unnamed protein product, partial [Mesorhabditis spiculigera]